MEIENGQLTGKIKFFNQNKGIGLIEPDNGGGDIFIHLQPDTPLNYQLLNHHLLEPNQKNYI
jgi:cold shock CspA family protein